MFSCCGGFVLVEPHWAYDGNWWEKSWIHHPWWSRTREFPFSLPTITSGPSDPKKTLMRTLPNLVCSVRGFPTGIQTPSTSLHPRTLHLCCINGGHYRYTKYFRNNYSTAALISLRITETRYYAVVIAMRHLRMKEALARWAWSSTHGDRLQAVRWQSRYICTKSPST